MAIKVKCKCGKAFGAPENLAGKRVKCPGCQDPVLIPGAASPAAAAKIKVACSCGKAIAVPATYAGKKVKCPGCGEPLHVPAGKAPAKAAASPSASAARADGGVGDLLDEADLSATTTGQRCPNCRKDLGPDDVLCIDCGYRLDSGRVMETKRVVKPTGFSMRAGPAKEVSVPKDVESLCKGLRFMGYLNLVCVLILLIGFVASVSGAAGELPPAIAGIIAVFGVVYFGIASIGVWIFFFAAKKVKDGRPWARVLSIVLGILTLPIGIYVLIKSFSPEVAAHCSGR
ncbi:MAG: hypothetical protein KDB27_21650 [Planctomycetales bacterium]|nr:hypothetical protein [Planctomycetales bacterium]